MASLPNSGGTSSSGYYYSPTLGDTSASDLVNVSRAICLAVGGTIKVTRPDGTAVSLNLPAGWHPISAIRIWSTGTNVSAADITVAV